MTGPVPGRGSGGRVSSRSGSAANRSSAAAATAAWARLEEAEESDPDYGLMWIGQSAGLIDEVLPAAEVVRRIVAEAEAALASAAQFSG